MTDISITLRLFGAFRVYGENVVFSVPSGSTAAKVKEKLAGVLKGADAALIRDSVLANDDEIIGNEIILTRDCRLAILPPVCGG
jgi:molybdopterin converting factor small subunit